MNNKKNAIKENLLLLETLENDKKEKVKLIETDLDNLENKRRELLKQNEEARNKLDAETFVKNETAISLLDIKEKMLLDELKKLKDNKILTIEEAQLREKEIRNFTEKENHRHMLEAKELLMKLETIYSKNNELLDEAEKVIGKIQRINSKSENYWFPQNEIKGTTLRGCLNNFKEFESYQLILNCK